MKQFVFTEWNKKKLGILFEDGKAMEIRCYEADSILGNVYRARVSNLSPNINAAFVDIKKGESCYLSMDDYHGEKLKVGDLVTVQVVRDKINGADRYVVYVSTKKDSGYKKFQTTGKNSTTITKYGKNKLKSGKTYYFYVVAQKKVDNKYQSGTAGNATKRWSMTY